MGTIALAPAELAIAAARLRRAGDDLSTVGVHSLSRTGAGDLGATELEDAVVELCDKGMLVVIALWNAVEQTGRNLAASGVAYTTVDERSMLVGRR